MPSHKFGIGEIVMVRRAISRNIPGGAYEVTKQLPHNGREIEYRIKSANEEHERVARESELTKAYCDRFNLKARLGLWRNNDTVEMIGLPIEFERSADVKSKVRGGLLQDFARRNRYPRAIDLHFVVAIDLSS
jgi:hypothetical protein